MCIRDSCYICLIPPLKHGMSGKRKWTVDNFHKHPKHCISYPSSPTWRWSTNTSASRKVSTCRSMRWEQRKGEYTWTFNITVSWFCATIWVRWGTQTYSGRTRRSQPRSGSTSKDKADFLGSRFRQWNLLRPDVNVTVYRNRQKDLMAYFKKENKLIVCCNGNGLMNSFNTTHRVQPTGCLLYTSRCV